MRSRSLERTLRNSSSRSRSRSKKWHRMPKSAFPPRQTFLWSTNLICQKLTPRRNSNTRSVKIDLLSSNLALGHWVKRWWKTTWWWTSSCKSWQRHRRVRLRRRRRSHPTRRCHLTCPQSSRWLGASTCKTCRSTKSNRSYLVLRRPKEKGKRSETERSSSLLADTIGEWVRCC